MVITQVQFKDSRTNFGKIVQKNFCNADSLFDELHYSTVLL